jgi:hypothetical protein
VYYGLIFIALVLSICALLKGYLRVRPLTCLLVLTLADELAAEFLHQAGKDFTWIYHLFNVFEYALFCLYLTGAIAKRGVRLMVYWSIPIYATIGTAISFHFYHYKGFPGMNINLEGFVLYLLCTYVLFHLDARKYAYIYQHPDFWICVGILAFFGGSFLFNGVYTYAIRLNKNVTLDLFGLTIGPLNIVLYISIIIGLLCLVAKRKFIIP